MYFGVDDVAAAMQLGLEAAAEVSKAFIKPIKLEFEKVGTWACKKQGSTQLAGDKYLQAARVTLLPLLRRPHCSSLLQRCAAHGPPPHPCRPRPLPSTPHTLHPTCTPTSPTHPFSSGVQSLPAHLQEALRGPAVDQAGEVGQD